MGVRVEEPGALGQLGLDDGRERGDQPLGTRESVQVASPATFSPR